jgi:group I intron endonuclease
MSKIYKIVNDINDKVYIGKTENSLAKRFAEHCKDSQKREEEQRPLYNAMRKYGVEHFSIELIEECDIEIVSMREQYWIGFYKGYTDGYNATLGGDGKAYINREEILDLWSSGKSLKEIVEIVKHDTGWVSQILQSNGVDKTEISKRSQKHWGNRAPKEVLMLDKNTNEVLGTFESTREAARYLISKDSLDPKSESGYSSHISEVCNGKRKTCQGYRWQYADL